MSHFFRKLFLKISIFFADDKTISETLMLLIYYIFKAYIKAQHTFKTGRFKLRINHLHISK